MIEQTAFDFDGATYDPAEDKIRLNRQCYVVWAAMCRGGWFTLEQLETLTHEPQASISARLRDFRKPRFGGHTILRRRVEGEKGLHEYMLIKAVKNES